MPQINLAPYSPEQQAIDRRRALAQALQQQSMEPLDLPQVAGARVSPLQGIAKVVQALAAAKQNRDLDRQQMALNKQIMDQRLAGATSMIGNMVPPAPDQQQNINPFPNSPIPDAALNQTITAPPSPEAQDARMQIVKGLAGGITSPDPTLSGLAQTQL